MSFSRLCHHLAAADQCRREGSYRLCSARLLVNHDIDRMKFQQVSTLTQYVFKDRLPVGAPLSEREKLLLLSCWQQWDPTGVQGSALSHWLVGLDVEHGPDGLDSPTFLKQNFDVQEAVHLYQEAQLGPVEDLFDVNTKEQPCEQPLSRGN